MQSKESIIPNLNKSSNLINNSMIIVDYFGMPNVKNISISSYEKKILSKYIYDELKVPKSKGIEYNSNYINLVLDFCRFYNFNT